MPRGACARAGVKPAHADGTGRAGGHTATSGVGHRLWGGRRQQRRRLGRAGRAQPPAARHRSRSRSRSAPHAGASAGQHRADDLPVRGGAACAPTRVLARGRAVPPGTRRECTHSGCCSGCARAAKPAQGGEWWGVGGGAGGRGRHHRGAGRQPRRWCRPPARPRDRRQLKLCTVRVTKELQLEPKLLELAQFCYCI
jgi:hypothetical protein